MTFQNLLNDLMIRFDCTNKDISAASGLSEPVVSRYRSGARTPKANSESLRMLVHGLAVLAEERGQTLDEATLLETLSLSVSPQTQYDMDKFSRNTKALLSALGITIKEMSLQIGYDDTYLAKVLRRERQPKKLGNLVKYIASYLAKAAVEQDKAAEIGALMGMDDPETAGELLLREHMIRFISPATEIEFPDEEKNKTPQNSFLQKLNEFDLDDYIKAIHFDDISLPNVPFVFPQNKHYTGIEAFKKSELDFMKAVVLSKSKDSVILYSDMPITEMSKDAAFSKNYMFGLAMMIKKGLHIDFIHDVNRPQYEMMLGLEGNIPLYMTGQISPYYLKHSDNRVFRNLLKVSGSAALAGEAITGHHAEGRYYLTTKKDEVKYYRQRAAALLEQAQPLMEIYAVEKAAAFRDYIGRAYDISGSRKMTFSSLPLFTMPAALLDRLLAFNGTAGDKADAIKAFAAFRRQKSRELFRREPISLAVPKIDKDRFESDPPALSVPELFLDFGLTYSYDIYREHLQQTTAFAAAFDNCVFEVSENLTFRNIDITIINGKEVCVSKAKSPTIHFVIKHPKIIRSFENFFAPIRRS